jgi:putative DNA methylase
MSDRKRLIEVTLPLTPINEASSLEKRNPFLKEHPRILHYWWARRPHTSARAVIFASLIDDPEDENAPSAYVEAVRQLPLPAGTPDSLRTRLFAFIRRLVDWDARNSGEILSTATMLIRLCNKDFGMCQQV